MIISISQNHFQTLTKTYDGYQDDIEKVEQVQALGAELDVDLSGQFYASAIQYLNKKTLVKTHVDSLLQRISQELNLPHLREILPKMEALPALIIAKRVIEIFVLNSACLKLIINQALFFMDFVDGCLIN